MKVKFLCGCVHEICGISEGTYDQDGMLVCPEHARRRYGWRSNGKNHARDGWTPLEVEQALIFDLMPSRPPIEIHHPKEDWRDNRDPELVWAGEKLK